MADHEEWRSYPGNSAYEVSNLGRVRSLWKRVLGTHDFVICIGNPRLLKTPRDGWGYQRCNLYSGKGVYVSRKVSQLVMETFVGPCPDGQEIRHGPLRLESDSLSNLSYGTPHENAADKTRDGTKIDGELHYRSLLTKEQAMLIYRRAIAGDESLTAIGKEFGVGKKAVSDIKIKRNWKSIHESVSEVSRKV